jgi:hypothetical protein
MDNLEAWKIVGSHIWMTSGVLTMLVMYSLAWDQITNSQPSLLNNFAKAFMAWWMIYFILGTILP